MGGDLISAGGQIFVVAASDASDHHFVNAAGVKFYLSRQSGKVVLPQALVSRLGRTAASALFVTLMQDNAICEISLEAGYYDFDHSLAAKRDADLRISGVGPATDIRLYDYAEGIFITQATSKTYNVTIEHFRIGRPDCALYGGVLGPKTLYVTQAATSTIRHIEEYGAIGFGVQNDRCAHGIITDVYAHDHFGGATHHSGSDGIHQSYCDRATFFMNRVEYVGDDALSCGGSYDGMTNPVLISIGNRVRYSGGSMMKIYNGCTSANVTGNRGEECTFGVAITPEATSSNVLAQNINAYANEFRRIYGTGGAIGGALYLYHWSGAVNSRIKNVTFHNNTIHESRCLSQSNCYATDHHFENIDVSDNTFIDFYKPADATGSDFVTLFRGGTGFLRFNRNKIKGYGSSSSETNCVLFDSILGDLKTTADQSYIAETEGNIFDVTQSNGPVLFIRGAPAEIRCRYNLFRGYKKKAAGSNQYYILILNPTLASVIEGNKTDGAVGINTGETDCFSTVDVLPRTTAPSSGSYDAGRRFRNSAVTAVGDIVEWQVIAGGTSGTLSGVTANTTNGSSVVNVSSTKGLLPGQYITISTAGITRAKILSISGDNLTLSATATSDQVAVSVAYEPFIVRALKAA